MIEFAAARFCRPRHAPLSAVASHGLIKMHASFVRGESFLRESSRDYSKVVSSSGGCLRNHERCEPKNAGHVGIFRRDAAGVPFQRVHSSAGYPVRMAADARLRGIDCEHPYSYCASDGAGYDRLAAWIRGWNNPEIGFAGEPEPRLVQEVHHGAGLHNLKNLKKAIVRGWAAAVAEVGWALRTIGAAGDVAQLP